MHTFSKRFLLTAGVLVITAILFAINLYVGSQGVREKLETALQRELKLPIHIGGLRYTLWGGLTATEATCEFDPLGNAGGTPSSITIPAVSARMAWLPLLSGRVVIEKLSFRQPMLEWVQGSDGTWNFSSEKPSAREEKKSEKSAKTEKKKERSKLEFGIEAVRIENAILRFIDRQGRTSVLLEGVNIYCRDPERPEGAVAIRKTILREGLVVESFAAPFSLNEGRVALAPVDARLAGGSIRGSFTLLCGPAPFFTLDLLYDGVDLHLLQAQFGEKQDSRQTAGTLHGNLDLYGLLDEKRSIRGISQIRLRNGRMDQFPLLQMIGKVLQIEELKNVELRQAQIDLRAAEGKVFVDSLVMESLNLGLTAKGTSEWDGSLNLAARLAVNPKVSRQLPGWVDANFQPIPGSDRRDIRFNITGSLSHPSTDLLQVMMGQKYGNQFLNLWQSLTGKGKKKPDEKKKPETPSTPEEGEDLISP